MFYVICVCVYLQVLEVYSSLGKSEQKIPVLMQLLTDRKETNQ